MNESNFSKLAFSPEIQDLAKLSLQQPIKITLKITLLDSLTFEWDSILINKELYICIPNTTTDNSKEAFIALLEFAEEELYCRKVIVYFDKNKNDRSKSSFQSSEYCYIYIFIADLLMRLFNFIGFTLLPPNHPTILTNQSDDMLYMEYNIEE